MTAEFNEVGFRFKYPANWTIEREKEEGWPRSVSVQGPSGAFWSVTEDPSITDLLDQIATTIIEEYDEVETSPLHRQIGQHDLEGKELAFYCLDFLVTAHLMQCVGQSRKLVILTQAESQDFDSLASVFDAMTFSLLSQA